MALSPDPRPAHGVWGPYQGAVLPDAWLNEAGQSATGALLDHLIRWHGAGGEPTAEMHKRIVDRVNELRAMEPDLAPRLHVLPDFHGNRSPRADATARGSVVGLTLDGSADAAVRLYAAAVQALAYGTRHICDACKADPANADWREAPAREVSWPSIPENAASVPWGEGEDPPVPAKLVRVARAFVTMRGASNREIARACGCTEGYVRKVAKYVDSLRKR